MDGFLLFHSGTLTFLPSSMLRDEAHVILGFTEAPSDKVRISSSSGLYTQTNKKKTTNSERLSLATQKARPRISCRCSHQRQLSSQERLHRRMREDDSQCVKCTFLKMFIGNFNYPHPPAGATLMNSLQVEQNRRKKVHFSLLARIKENCNQDSAAA